MLIFKQKHKDLFFLKLVHWFEICTYSFWLYHLFLRSPR